MNEFNKYQLYSINQGINFVPTRGDVDRHFDKIKVMNDYKEIKSYLKEHFNFENGEKYIKDDKSNTVLILNLDEDNSITIKCAEVKDGVIFDTISLEELSKAQVNM